MSSRLCIRTVIGGLAMVLSVSFDAQASSFAAGSTTSEKANRPSGATFEVSGAAGTRQLSVLLTNLDPASAPESGQFDHESPGPFLNLGTNIAPGEVACSGNNCVNVAGGSDVRLPSGARGGVGSHIGAGGYGYGRTAIGSSAAGAASDTDAVVAGAVSFVLDIPKGLERQENSQAYLSPSNGSSRLGTYAAPRQSGRGDPTTGRLNVPEPAALSLLGLALLGVGYRLRRRTTLD